MSFTHLDLERPYCHVILIGSVSYGQVKKIDILERKAYIDGFQVTLQERKPYIAAVEPLIPSSLNPKP